MVSSAADKPRIANVSLLNARMKRSRLEILLDVGNFTVHKSWELVPVN